MTPKSAFLASASSLASPSKSPPVPALTSSSSSTSSLNNFISLQQLRPVIQLLLQQKSLNFHLANISPA
ncbi:hypothetical protein DSO57_1024170 [Entomophthora muscae]|uniref:Uncharacterized protein n=1 Tax=Entomophthora muscae TaxID=34485 RepID=A0ACC2RHL3_9FUNG|nr:hypothetical protein DSO57_1024170 [Entomophthora muscae]